MSTSMVKRTFLISEEDEQEIITRGLLAQQNAPLFAAMVRNARVSAKDYYLELELKIDEYKNVSTMVHLRKKGDEQ